MSLKPINKQITINATADKVWKVLLSKETYLQWASVFQEGSDYLATDNFIQGSKVIFGDGTGNGMVALVSINEINHKIQFTFTGESKDGVEKSMGEFDGMTETYTLTQNGEEILLNVETSMMDEWYDSMDKAWDKAMVIIKELSEK
jgi:Activator of Hsp90 ATPase homolog 1-like protein